MGRALGLAAASDIAGKGSYAVVVTGLGAGLGLRMPLSGRCMPACLPACLPACCLPACMLMCLRTCGVEARSGYPAASRHATTSPGAVSAPDHHGAEQADKTRGGVDLHGVAAGLPRQTTRRHAPFRSMAPRNLRSQLLELGVAAGKLLGEPDVVDTAEGRLQAEALDRPANTIHKDGLTVGDCNDPPTEIICT